MNKSIDSIGDVLFVPNSQSLRESQDAAWQPSSIERVDQAQTLETRAKEVVSEQLLSERKCARSLCAHRGGTARGVADALASQHLTPGGVIPGLPAIVVGSTLDLLMHEQWGNVFTSPAAGLTLPVPPNTPANTIPITAASIDKIFAWDKSLISNTATLQRYAQVILDLLELPTGRSLIRDIIMAHHSCKGISSLVFTMKPSGIKTNVSKCDWNDYPEACEISLEWYHENMLGGIVEGPLWDDWGLVVNDTAANQFNFVRVDVPPAIVLAHELGHFLYGINMQKRSMERSNGTLVQNAIADAINLAATHGGDMGNPTIAASISALARVIDKEMSVYAYTEYMNIFRSFFVFPPVNPVEESFTSCWGDDYEELVNILPSANILQNGDLDRSDGKMIHEALNTWAVDPKCPQFFTLTDAAGVAGAAPVNFLTNPAGVMTDAAGNALTSERFVRFSHEGSAGLFTEFNKLNAVAPAGALSEQDRFRNLVGQLLNNIITIPAGAGGVPAAVHLTIADLPRI
jgi:hypothetical protein